MKRLALTVIILTFLLMPRTLAADNTFYRILAAKPNATFADAVRGFLELCTEGDAGKMSFEEQSRILIDAKIIQKKWTAKPDEKLTRGCVAYMLCRVSGISGGLTMRVFGTSERYGFRECVFKGVWRGGNQRDYVTGGELMGVFKWAADYLDEHPKKKGKLRGTMLDVPAPAPPTTPPKAFGPSAQPATTPVDTISDELDKAGRKTQPAEQNPQAPTTPAPRTEETPAPPQ